jgi:hypothetical protein
VRAPTLEAQEPVSSADIPFVAIEERNTSAGLADPGAAGDEGAEPTARSLMSLDDLRLRLDSPLFAREPGLAAAAPMPHLRELTWEHVINPTSSLPTISSDTPGESTRPAPIRVEELMARPEPVLAPLPERADAPPAVRGPLSVEPSAEPTAAAPAAPPAPSPISVAPLPTSAPEPTRAAPATGSTSLPSFAAMLSGEVATVPSWSSDRMDDELVKPIEEPPPVARDTDPEVNDLAALILRSTPTGATPTVAEVSPVQAPVEARAELEVESPAPDPAIEVATPHPPVHSMMSPPLVRDTGVTPVVSGSTVEAELNRLAYVPDLDEDPAGPVEVPEIAYSDLRSAPAATPPSTPTLTPTGVPTMPPSIAPTMAPTAVDYGAPTTGSTPQLSQNELFMPRQVAQVHRHAYTDLVAQAAPVMPRKRKRHLFRKFVTTVVLLGMVAGGLFAVKHFILDRVDWPKDIAPLAREVEGERGLHFTKDLPVTTLDAQTYAAKLSAGLGDLTEATARPKAGMWRALGLSTGTLSPTTEGLAAAVDQPAFYDPSTAQIYVLADLPPELRSFALHRALTMALLDQQFKWSSQLTQAAPTVVVGTKAIFDADAIAVALRLVSDRDRAVLPDQRQAIATTNNVPPVDAAPFASATMGSIGVPLWPYLASLGPDQRNSLEQTGVMSDSHALDLRRLTAGATDTVGTTTQGMLFWYHALASRTDDNLAWQAALGWRGDEVRLDTTGPTMCVLAKVTIDAPVAPLAVFAFTAWANAAPPQSGTTMTPTTSPDGQTIFAIHACDPGESVPTNDGKASLAFGGAALRVQQFVELTVAKRSLSAAQAACAVYTTDAIIPDDARPLFDPPTGWLAPSKHPAPDPSSAACAALAAPSTGGATAADGSAPAAATTVPPTTVPASTVPAKKKP